MSNDLLIKDKLSKFNNIEQDLLFWVNIYLRYKTLDYYQKNDTNKIESISDVTQELRNSTSIEKTKEIAYKLKHNGLKSISKLIGATVSFYGFIQTRNNTEPLSMQSLNADLIEDYKENIDLAQSSKKVYVDVIIELLTLVGNSNTDGFKYDLDVDKIRLPKVRTPLTDAMDKEEFKKFNKDLPKSQKNKSDFERARNILMCRILLYSGITAGELESLQLNKNFFLTDKGMKISFPNRIEIDLPRALLISYFNEYKTLSKSEHNYDIETNLLFNLSRLQIDTIVKNALLSIGINRKPLTAKLLRVSFAVYLYNSRTEDKQISVETIKELLNLKNKDDLMKMINFHDKKFAKVSNIFLKDLQ